LYKYAKLLGIAITFWAKPPALAVREKKGAAD
jgi:hypothetical protein